MIALHCGLGQRGVTTLPSVRDHLERQGDPSAGGIRLAPALLPGRAWAPYNERDDAG